MSIVADGAAMAAAVMSDKIPLAAVTAQLAVVAAEVL